MVFKTRITVGIHVQTSFYEHFIGSSVHLIDADREGRHTKKALEMTETNIDYWTCMDLAEALEQTMRNDLWTTADQIAETATCIANKPEELIAALQKYELQKAANCAASEVADSTITTISPPAHFSKAG